MERKYGQVQLDCTALSDELVRLEAEVQVRMGANAQSKRRVQHEMNDPSYCLILIGCVCVCSWLTCLDCVCAFLCLVGHAPLQKTRGGKTA